MSPAARRIALLTTLLLVPATSREAWSQEWSVSARVGRVTYDGAPTGASAASSIVLGLGRTAPRDWFGASTALPIGTDPFWAVLGGWKRLQTRGANGLLLDLSGHGFIQRQTVNTGAPAPGPLPGPVQPPPVGESTLSGQGVGAELMAGGFAGSRSIRLETRAGVAAQRSRLGEVLRERTLPTGDSRLTLVLAPLTVQGETRAWLDDSTTHGYMAGTLQYARGALRVWGSLGEWVAGGRDGLSWSAGAATPMAPRIELQLGGRGNSFDPLYLSSTATSFWAGFSIRLGSSHASRAPVAERARDGGSVIRIPARSANGIPSIAGDFTGWKPVPMRREGSHWTFTARLTPGVYHYAFVGEDGTWFVPESVPGRQPDGMGGYVAVLVVS